MISYTGLKPGTTFVKDGSPFVVIQYTFSRKEAQKPVARIKIRHLLTSKVTDYTVSQNETFEEADIKRIPAVFIYKRNDEFWFYQDGDKSIRFSLDSNICGESAKFMKEGLAVTALLYNDSIVSIELPIKVDLIVKDAPPSIRGNTADGGTKTVILETGSTVNTPLFINSGDVIRINTETSTYTERVEKDK
jgi:elongation factor P